MRREWIRRNTGLLFSCLLASLWSVGAYGACTLSSATMPPEELERFASSPRKLLDENPSGGILLQGSLSELAMSSVAMIKPIEEVARYANLQQSETIGSALARAFRRCRGKEDALASLIRRSAMSSPNSAVRRAFLDHTDLDDIDPASSAARSTQVEKSHSTIRIDPDSKKLPSPFAPVQLY